MNLGREKLDWSHDLWNRIDQAAHDECQRTKVATKLGMGSAHRIRTETILIDSARGCSQVVYLCQLLMNESGEQSPFLYLNPMQEEGLP